MKKFQGKINGVAYNNEEEFKNAFSNLDMTKPYNVSFSSEEKTDMGNEKKELTKEDELTMRTNLYPNFDIDELSQNKMAEDFIKNLTNKLEGLIEDSKNLDDEYLEAHLTNLHEIKDSWHEKLTDTNQAYNKILSCAEDLQNQIDNLNNKLDFLDNSLDYIEAISQFYENYQEKLESLSKEHKVSAPKAKEPIKTSSKQVKEQKEINLDDKVIKSVRDLIDILFS